MINVVTQKECAYIFNCDGRYLNKFNLSDMQCVMDNGYRSEIKQD